MSEATKTAYTEAVRAWFFERAFVPEYYAMGRYPDEKATAEFKTHVDTCPIQWASEPDFGTVAGFAGTFAEDDKVRGIRAEAYCSCDEYERYEPETLFIPGEMSLGELIAEVLAADEEKRKAR